MLKNYILFFVFGILFVACDNNKIDSNLKKSNQYRIEKDFSNAIIELKKAEKLYHKSKDIDKINFLLGEIYLNDIKDYNYAIEEFKKITEKSKLFAKAIFMIGYIYSNNLNEYTEAIKYYTLFTNNYSKHELFPSVQYELNQLLMHQDVIDSLNTIAKSRKVNNGK